MIKAPSLSTKRTALSLSAAPCPIALNKIEWNFQLGAARWSLRSWNFHGGRALGRAGRYNRGLAVEGAVPRDARDQCSRHYPGQAGSKEHVRVPGIQNENARADLRLDLQSQDQGQAGQVDARRCGTVTADVNYVYECDGRADDDGNRYFIIEWIGFDSHTLFHRVQFN